MTIRARAEGALLGTTLIWGGTFVATKFVLAGISPIQLITIRFLIASVFFLGFFRQQIFPIPLSSAVKGSILGLFLFLGFVAQTIGLLYTTASKSAFITGMMVVFVPLLQFVIERRAPTIGNIVGVGVVSAGLWFLTSPTGADFNAGDALTLFCALLFGLYIVYLDVISREMTALQLTFLQTASSSFLGLACLFFFESFEFTLTVPVLFSVLYLTALATILTTYLQTRYQKDTTPTRAVVIFTLEPVFAAIFAYVILSEHLGVLGILGGGLIVTGVLISELSDLIPWFRRSLD